MAQQATVQTLPPDGSSNFHGWNSVKARTAYIINKIYAAKSLDELFIEIKKDLATLFEVEQLTIYAVDRDKRQIYSKFLLDSLDGVKEIRVPIDEASISGYCARHSRIVNIGNAYDGAELAKISPSLTFDQSWDKRTNFCTRQMLAVPIMVERKALMGVLLLINKRSGDRFTPEEEGFANDIADALGMAMRNQSQLVERRPTKFDYLVEQLTLTQKDLDNATEEARRKGTDIEAVLQETYRVSKALIGESLSRYYGSPFLAYDEKLIVDRTLLRNLNIEFLKANFWLPLRKVGDITEVLIDNPRDLLKTERIELLLRGRSIRWLVSLRKDILMYIGSATGNPVLTGTIQNILGEMAIDPTVEDEEAGIVGENDNVIVRLANQIILDAFKRGASDIHIEPYSSRTDTVIRMRVDGSCAEYQRIPPGYRRALVSRLKIMARLDIAERRKPQDGKINFRLPQGPAIELRVATIPTSQGDEDMVLRILGGNEPLALDALNMTARNLREVRRLIEMPYGLFLVVGPTGSGKTTTLHAALAAINKPDLKIWTAEDPVEITQYGLRQVQVQPRIGFSFAAAMRAFLRADPDVIMVGEMRDEETVHTAIEASLTGHMVFSTLHTNSAPETVTRLLEMGLDPFNFADALLGILAQRLARTLCNTCKVPYVASELQIDQLRQAYGEDAFERLPMPASLQLYRCKEKGCDECHNTGYRGRIGLHELMVATPELKRLIQTRARNVEIAMRSQQEGMTTLLQDGVLKVIQGVTDMMQVKAVASK